MTLRGTRAFIARVDAHGRCRLTVTENEVTERTLETILTPERTCHNLAVSSKKKALEEVATRMVATLPMLTTEQVFENLVAREKLGTTGVGHGVAIPHCRLPRCSGIVGGLFRLTDPIDFGALDGEPVSILFALLVPTREVDEHLDTLATLAARFEVPTYREGLMEADSDEALYQAALQVPVSRAEGQ